MSSEPRPIIWTNASLKCTGKTTNPKPWGHYHVRDHETQFQKISGMCHTVTWDVRYVNYASNTKYVCKAIVNQSNFGSANLCPQMDPKKSPYSFPKYHMLLTYYSRGGRLSRCPELFLFRCKSCLNNIIRCFMKFEVYRSGLGRNPVQILALSDWMFTYWATTLYPGPLFTSKHDRSTSFIIRDRLTCWKPDLVELGIPPFLAPLMLKFSREMGQNATWYLANYCSVLPHICCNDIHVKMTQIGSVGGDI